MSRFRGNGKFWGTLQLLGGGVAGAVAVSLAGLPAGALIGAVVGSALVNRISRRSRGRGLPAAVRIAGMILLGTVAGGRLDASALTTLLALAIPMVLVVLALIVLDLVLTYLLIRKYGFDPSTAVLACAPGGLSEVVATAIQVSGARIGVILAVHTARILVVVLVVLPLLIITVGSL